ncbi:MoaD/ThiS family protein [Nocardioides dubius]|uniref:Molybdopterin synthase sulfur carrier subunit n=1 Tax=Nocardioides dubius TaxID=317019 RepID=A0ABN1U2H4_9ACTN
MELNALPVPHSGTVVTVRFWAAARAATGCNEERYPLSEALTVAALRALVVARHPDADAVIGVCSVLVNDQPVNGEEAARHRLRDGDAVEFLPPFAGG